MLREGHGKRNRSSTAGERHGIVLNLKNIAHISASFMRFLSKWELHANANEPCTQNMRICARIQQFFANLSGDSNHSTYILHVFFL